MDLPRAHPWDREGDPVKPLLVPTLIMLACTMPAAAKDYGQHGTLWPVIEQIEARLKHLEASGETARLNERLKQRTIARVNRPEPVAGIIHAASHRSWQFDPTISAERDIADEKGRIIIARGTRVNPLDTVSLRAALVFLDGDDPAQLTWASARYGKTNAKLILVRGAPLALMRARQRRFYFDQGGTLVKHFGIRAVPAVVEQQGRMLRITETPVKPGGRTPS
jgi:conjugal transfer pilus assembly protein TraW